MSDARPLVLDSIGRDKKGLLVTFLTAAAYESGCVLWVIQASGHNAAAAAGWSAFNACVTIVGVESFLQSLGRKVAFILGYAIGTCLTVLLSS